MRSDGFLRNLCIWTAVGAVCVTARQMLVDVPMPQAVLAGASVGVLFGLFMAVLGAVASDGYVPPFETGELVAALRDLPRDAVNVRESITLPLAPDQALAVCRATLRADGHFAWVRAEPATGMVRARGRMSWQSWGERIQIRVEPVEGGSRVEIRSWPRIRATRFDSGTNRGNVERIRAALAKHAPQALAAAAPPEAPAPIDPRAWAEAWFRART
ncbi:MAG TPA: DUF1499 domain-containing protein [Longimicrobium sp.]|nr:DUF1499 domain-containing protein [Longimicrobium sp.]